MQEQGIISPVPFSNWAVPVVAVVKGDGSVRVCSDYKLTVNQASQLDHYPLPGIDLFFQVGKGPDIQQIGP